MLDREDVPTRIWPLPARKINGIGPKASDKLTRLGIHTVGEVAITPVDFLIRHFGSSTGRWMHQVAQGIDDRPLVTESEPKSISRESTFERDLHVKHDRSELSEAFTSLCLRVANDLERKGYACRTIGIKLRYSDFQSVTRDVTLPRCVNDAAQIRKAAGECLKRVPMIKRIRLLGVRVGGLIPLDETDEGFSSVQAELPI